MNNIKDIVNIEIVWIETMTSIETVDTVIEIGKSKITTTYKDGTIDEKIINSERKGNIVNIKF